MFISCILNSLMLLDSYIIMCSTKREKKKSRYSINSLPIRMRYFLPCSNVHNNYVYPRQIGQLSRLIVIFVWCLLVNTIQYSSGFVASLINIYLQKKCMHDSWLSQGIFGKPYKYSCIWQKLCITHNIRMNYIDPQMVIQQTFYLIWLILVALLDSLAECGRPHRKWP